MHTYRCVCATVVLRILFQTNLTASELFHSRSLTEQNLLSLPGHSHQWDKIIMYVAQTHFYLFVLLREYICKKRKKYSSNIKPS
jgi:hypothetical protein